MNNKEIEQEWSKLDIEGKARYNGFKDFKEKYKWRNNGR
jgi:hypothetical protein